MSKKSNPVESMISQLFCNNYRLAESRWVGGDNNANVALDEKPKAASWSRRVWHKRNCWSGTDLNVEINVSPRWRRNVRDRGLAVIDGLLTTHAGRVRRLDGIEVYPASWVRQGRGLSVRDESGWLALHRQSGTAYHLPGGTPKGAVARLRRKPRSQAIPQEERDARRRQRAQARKARFERLVQRLASHDLADIGEVAVTRQDSLKAGNCVPGTDQFIANYFPQRTSVSIAEIVEAIGQTDLNALDDQQLTLARQIAATCLMAIRRARREKRAQN